MLEKWFHLKEYQTNVKTEIIAGITTFLSAGYILAVVPTMLKAAGMNQNAVFITTALITAVASICMGLLANFPLILGPGLGTAALFAFTVVPELGSWQAGMATIFLSGIIFVVISLTGLRKVIINAIPNQLKYAISVGIGCFIAFIGLKNAGLVVAHDSNFVALGEFKSPSVLLAACGILITLILLARNTPLAIFWGMMATVVLGFVMGCFGIKGMPALPHSWHLSCDFSNMGGFIEGFKTLGQSIPNALLIVFSFLFIDFFDTAGTLTATVTRLKECSGDYNRQVDRALLVDSSATVVGSSMGVSSITTLVESASGIEVGGRTGLTAIVSGVLFALATFISPIIQSLITPAVTAPALVAVGLLMCRDLVNISWDDFIAAASCMITVLCMILSFSISNGIAIGFLTYTVMMIATKKAKQLHPMVYILDILFIAYFYFIN